MAGERGLEPLFTGPEPVVLPFERLPIGVCDGARQYPSGMSASAVPAGLDGEADNRALQGGTNEDNINPGYVAARHA